MTPAFFLRRACRACALEVVTVVFFLMRRGDIQLAFPVLALGIAVLAVPGSSVLNGIVVLGGSGRVAPW